ncbi:MAG: carboxylesterase family protein [bacterium JZ-2024 1]
MGMVTAGPGGTGNEGAPDSARIRDIATDTGAPFLPSISSPIAPSEYLLAGPFLAGSREGMIDFATDVGGEANIRPKEGDEIPSWMVKGGIATWRKVPAEGGATDAEFVGVDWEALQTHWGWAGGFYVAYAYTEVDIPRPSRALAVAERISMFYINGVPYVGDIYGHNFLRVPVELKKGTNRVLIRFGRGDRINFSFRLEPVASDLVALTNDVTYGNPVTGEHLDTFVAIPVLNATDRIVRDGQIRVSWTLSGASESVTKNLPPLAPYGVYKEHLWVHSSRAVEAGDLSNGHLPLRVELLRKEFVVSRAEVVLRTVGPNEPRRIAFVSRMDLSVQVFSIYFPVNYDPVKRYALIVTLHGAGASDEGQVRSYVPKDWAFIVAPTNRRNFGFDWQDWGRLDALEVIDYALRNFPIDPDRIYLTGHSMGGHGTWHIGLKHADRFAAIAPSAGWTDFSLYVPPFTRRSLLFSTPLTNAVWLSAFAPDLFPPYAPNALHLKILSLVGGDDEQVPPVHVRMATDILRKAGAEAAMIEVPGQGHWFDFPETPGTDCTDHPSFMELFQRTRRRVNPRKVSFYSADLADSSALYWVRVFAPRIFGLPVRVTAEVRGNTEIHITTENVRAFTLHPEGLLKSGRVTLIVDGKRVDTDYNFATGITLVAHKDGWKAGEWQNEPRTKTSEHSGPIKRAYFSPFLIVYADYGSPEETALFRQLAVYESFVWYWRGNGIARTLPESRLINTVDSPFITGRFNVIIYGTPESSPFIREQFAKMPFNLKVTPFSIRFGNHEYSGNRLGLKMVYPLLDDNASQILVVYNTGTSPEAVHDVSRWPVLLSGSALPDFILTSPEALGKGWGGLLGAGFFDEQWLPEGPLAVFR